MTVVDRPGNRQADRGGFAPVNLLGGLPAVRGRDFRMDRHCVAGVPGNARERDGCAAAAPQRGMRALRRQLDVLWVVFQAAHDEDILQPPGHEELVLPDDAQVASSEERTVIIGIG